MNERTGKASAGQRRNAKLAAVIAEAGWSHAQLAQAVGRVAAEAGNERFVSVGRSHVSHWVAGSTPSGDAPAILVEAISRRLGRVVTVDEIGLSGPQAPAALDWSADTLATLADLGRGNVDIERRSVLRAAGYSVASLAVPSQAWWDAMARRGGQRSGRTGRVIGAGYLEAIREMSHMFTRIDQRRGGGHARTAVVQYLTSDVASALRAAHSSSDIRRGLFSTAGELAYLSGWMAFDNAEHATAQKYFTVAVAAYVVDGRGYGVDLQPGRWRHQRLEIVGFLDRGVEPLGPVVGGDRHWHAVVNAADLVGRGGGDDRVRPQQRGRVVVWQRLVFPDLVHAGQSE